jgi:hypothetical protein
MPMSGGTALFAVSVRPIGGGYTLRLAARQWFLGASLRFFPHKVHRIPEFERKSAVGIVK